MRERHRPDATAHVTQSESTGIQAARRPAVRRYCQWQPNGLGIQAWVLTRPRPCAGAPAAVCREDSDFKFTGNAHTPAASVRLRACSALNGLGFKFKPRCPHARAPAPARLQSAGWTRISRRSLSFSGAVASAHYRRAADPSSARARTYRVRACMHVMAV
jgi:hypothetical protein